MTHEGIIYKIESLDDTPLVYYGSTTKTLEDRITMHLRYFTSWKRGGMHYLTSFEIIKLNRFAYEIVEKVKFDSKNHLLARESYYINNFPCINNNLAVNDNFKKTEYGRKYYKEHRQKMDEYNKNYNHISYIKHVKQHQIN